jgi:predicted AAA+ superfamily ATPase
MINRDLENKVCNTAKLFPVLTITGPRQSGKSTLCKMLFPRHDYVNLEAPDVRRFALNDPRGFLSRFKNGAILDEIQRCPEIPSYLQVMVDEEQTKGKWVLTGSQNLALLESVSQSLAGRTGVLHLLPLTHNEIQKFKQSPKTIDQIMLTGGYPAILDQKISPADWQSSYIATYLERDVRSISKITDLVLFQRFVELCAGRTGQLLNLSSLAADAGISQPTAKAWLSVLETSFLVFRLPPFLANLRKRLVKMSKLFFYDTGLVCWLLGIRSANQLKNHPLRGSIFETWIISEIIKHRMNQGLDRGVFFYRDRHGQEIDLLIDHGDKFTAVEAKAGQTISEDIIKKSLRYEKSLSSIKRTQTVIAYTGQMLQSCQDVSFTPWDKIAKQIWT